jgi:hypothetical protein
MYASFGGLRTIEFSHPELTLRLIGDETMLVCIVGWIKWPG